MTVSMTSAINLVFPGLLGFGFPGGYEWIILLVLGLLIFGRRLPEVGRSLGKSIVEFKKGIRNIETEIESESSRPDRIDAAPHEELPRPSEPAEPRVSHDAMGAGGTGAAGEPEKVEQPATGGSDADRGSG